MKTFFIIPGFKQKSTDSNFVWLEKFLSEKGFRVILVSITWDRKVMSDYVAEFEEFFNRNKGKDNYVLGFSYGAVIAFVTAQKLQPKKIFLCSLSPDFKEDLKHQKQWILNYIGKRRVVDTLTRSGVSIAKKLTVPSVVFYGEKEGKQYPDLKKRCEETVLLATHSKLVIVKDSPHNISHQEYMDAIKVEF